MSLRYDELHRTWILFVTGDFISFCPVQGTKASVRGNRKLNVSHCAFVSIFPDVFIFRKVVTNRSSTTWKSFQKNMNLCFLPSKYETIEAESNVSSEHILPAAFRFRTILDFGSATEASSTSKTWNVFSSSQYGRRLLFEQIGCLIKY